MDPAVAASEAAMAELLEEEEAEAGKAVKKGVKKQKGKAKKKNSKEKVTSNPSALAYQ